MANVHTNFSNELHRLADSAGSEFDYLSDYIWKSPKLLEQETKLELRKLKVYFPNDSEGARLRWAHESHKLTRVFPYLIAVGNLFMATSIFESYMFLLAEAVKGRTGVAVETAKGAGIRRLFSYLKLVGISPSKIPLFEQVMAGIRIRNCFAHASGVLDWTREAKELIRLQSTRAYLSKDHRRRMKSLGKDPDDLLISNTKLGKKLVINNGYPHVLTSYFRDYFFEICKSAKVKFAQSPKTGRSTGGLQTP